MSDNIINKMSDELDKLRDKLLPKMNNMRTRNMINECLDKAMIILNIDSENYNIDTLVKKINEFNSKTIGNKYVILRTDKECLPDIKINKVCERKDAIVDILTDIFPTSMAIREIIQNDDNSMIYICIYFKDKIDNKIVDSITYDFVDYINNLIKSNVNNPNINMKAIIKNINQVKKHPTDIEINKIPDNPYINIKTDVKTNVINSKCVKVIIQKMPPMYENGDDKQKIIKGFVDLHETEYLGYLYGNLNNNYEPSLCKENTTFDINMNKKNGIENLPFCSFEMENFNRSNMNKDMLEIKDGKLTQIVINVTYAEKIFQGTNTNCGNNTTNNYNTKKEKHDPKNYEAFKNQLSYELKNNTCPLEWIDKNNYLCTKDSLIHHYKHLFGGYAPTITRELKARGIIKTEKGDDNVKIIL